MTEPVMHEKDTASHVEGETLQHVDHDEEQDRIFIASLSTKAKRAAVRKVDLRLMPLLTFLYLMSYIDRTNIGNVKIEGIMDDINLEGNRFNVAQSIFFIPYCLLEIPSNWFLSRSKRPSWFLGGLVIAWGLVMTFSGFVNTYASLCVVRIFLGVTEAGFYPGALFLISRWYQPAELQMRIAYFYAASAAAGAFSGLLAYGIAHMDGLAGYRGWRWIFIIEGIMSVLGGIACLVLLPDSPALSSSWLSSDEMRYLQTRRYAEDCSPSSLPSSLSEQEQRQRRSPLRDNDGGNNDHESPWVTLWKVMTDWQIYVMIIIYWANALPNYALKFNMPQIIQNMGYTSSKAQLLTVPPYTIGGLSAFASSYIADRFRWRMPFIVVGLVCVITSYAILFSFGALLATHAAQSYFALFLACAGFYPILPGANAWILSNMAGRTKRAMGIAYLAALGNLGGIPGAFIFTDDEAPRYPTGYGTSFAVAAGGVVACLGLEICYKQINKRRGRKSDDEWRRELSEQCLKDMGDRSPLFRYTL